MPQLIGGANIHSRRIHVLRPEDWGTAPGSDFWLVAGNILMDDGAALDLVNYGWQVSGGVHLVSTGADFLASADVGTTGGIHMDTAGDTVASPEIFGDYPHARMAEAILGAAPTTLNAEFYMRLSANNDEQASGAGFWENGATSAFAKGDCMAVVASGGTNFELHSGAAEDAGSTDNTTAHLFKITFTFGSTVEWWIDGTSQGTVAIQTDLWPCAFGVNTQGGGSNDPVLNWAHVYYE